MKYIIICLAAAIVVYGAAYVIARLIINRIGTNTNTNININTNTGNGRHHHLKTALITALLGTALFIIAALAYLGIYYHADNRAKAALKGNDKVSVSEIDSGYFFDGPASERAVVFYPGAKVECEAYAALMLKLAENGYDCFLLDMPLNFALLGENIADQVLNTYDYDSWLVAGHSMGGIVASDYAVKHPDRISGIILLASYSTDEIDNSFKVYSIYGSEDSCLDRDAYNDNKHNLPDNTYELVIEGGNHSQFGNYGNQKGDGEADISSKEQQRITAEAVANSAGDCL